MALEQRFASFLIFSDAGDEQIRNAVGGVASEITWKETIDPWRSENDVVRGGPKDIYTEEEEEEEEGRSRRKKEEGRRKKQKKEEEEEVSHSKD